MQKYPLEIAERDRELWESRIEAARQREIRLRFLHSGLKHISPKEGSFIGKLMPFQKEGATWLYHTQRGLLADEMGLGKNSTGTLHNSQTQSISSTYSTGAPS